MEKDVCPLPGASQNRPLPLLLSPQIRMRMISSMAVLAPHREVEKALSVVRLAPHKPLVPVDVIVGV